MATAKDRIYWATELALKNIVTEGFDDIFVSGRAKHWSHLIEFELIQHKKLQEQLLSDVRKDLLAAYRDQGSKRPNCLVDYKKYQNPKRSGLYAYRHAALLEPKTTLGYLSLTILFAQAIEDQRLPISENRIFSYRFKPDEKTGCIFSDDTSLGYKGFLHEELRQMANDENKILLTADISHFYDSVNLHVLENELRDAASDNDCFLSMRVTCWLDRFLQQTDTGWSRGIPVGNNASRILAEASLIGLDRHLKNKNINFIRFVDDFRIFARDAIEAQKALEILNSKLNAIGLALNDSKVSLKSITDANRDAGKALISGHDVDIAKVDYEDLIPMNYVKSQKTPKVNGEYEAKLAGAYSKYEAGEQLTEQREVKYLIRSILESDNVDKKKRVVDVFEKYLSFSKFICSFCEKDYTEIKLKEHVFEWFKDQILHLPNHAAHALFGMSSHTPELKERAVREILMNDEFRFQLDSFIYREAMILLRTNLSKDDLEDLNRNIINFDGWTKRAIAYCIWRGSRFNQKAKQARLSRISDNNNDAFLKFLSQVRHADFDKIET